MTDRKQAMTDLLEKVEIGEWRVVPGCSQYLVSEFGLVWSAKSQRALSQNPCDKGYPMVHVINDEGVRITRKVHVLVASAFHGPKPKGAEIRHLDGNKENASAKNLRHGSRRQNLLDRKRHDLPITYKLSPNDVKVIKRRLAEGERQTDIAQDYGVHRCTIGDIYRGRRHADINA